MSLSSWKQVRKTNNRQDKRTHHPILGPALLDDVDIEVTHSFLSSVAAAVTGEGEVGH